MIPTFYIDAEGAQKERSQSFREILNGQILQDICKRLTGLSSYKVMWRNERNKGRMITFETDNTLYYITLSREGHVGACNSYFQSVPTAFANFLRDYSSIHKSKQFCFYFLPFTGNNKTDYMLFMYNILQSIGIRFINADYGLGRYVATVFPSVKSLMDRRNELRSANTGNQSTYVTDEGAYYHIYGKTFGANQKETTLLCMALCKVSDKPIRLFQIEDNESTSISQNDIDAILTYARYYGTKGIKILDDTYDIDEFDEQEIQPAPEENLRNPRFIYNLLEKTNGIKHCTLCDCNIESIIQAAHIFPVKNIRQMNTSFEEKLALATDKDNSMWLCENHHKLFDSGQIHFVNDEIQYSSSLSNDEKDYLNEITTTRRIEHSLYTEGMKRFLTMRDRVYMQHY